VSTRVPQTLTRGAYVGQPVRRREDRRHLTGQGEFGGDVNRPEQLYARIVRSPLAAARIVAVHTEAARALDGVVAVFTADEIPDVHVPVRVTATENTGKILQPVIARDEVRYVGEPVALIIATDPYLAEDAEELVELELEPRPPLVELHDAAHPEAAPIHPALGSNLIDTFRIERGDIDEVFATAPVTVTGEFLVQRHGAVPLEPRALVAEVDPRDGRLTVWGVAKVKHVNRRILGNLLDRPEDSIRSYETDVGGGFGGRGEFYPEDFLIPWAATRLGRAVKWVEDRQENLMALNQSREQRWAAEAAATEDGRLLALRAKGLWSQGAYIRTHGNVLLWLTVNNMSGPYEWPAYDMAATGVVTNKTPAGTYRGPGQFESTFLRERMLDLLARRLDMDPVELRRRNLLTRDRMPYFTGAPDIDTKEDTTYEDSDYREVFDACMRRAGYEELRAEVQRRRAAGELVGVGTSCFVELGSPGAFEEARAVAEPDGTFTIHIGVGAVGQGMETIMSQIAADELGVAIERVTISYRDTDDVPAGLGAFSSRGTMYGGNAVIGAVRGLAERARAAAAERLNVAPEEVTVTAGEARVAAEAPIALGRLGIEHRFRYAPPHYSHVVMGADCVLVAIDRVSGQPRVERWVIAYDTGRVINPLLLTGQVRGAAAQGLGGSLFEEFVYDAQGQPQSTSFIDYALPTAAEVPTIEVELLELGSGPEHDALNGAKGGGEGGIVGSAAAIANAVADALGGDSPVFNRLPLRAASLLGLVPEPAEDPA
jgi:aerobic carbon-monoxide dehydrogenase large subunit